LYATLSRERETSPSSDEDRSQLLSTSVLMWEAKGAASAERVSVQEGTAWQTVDAGVHGTSSQDRRLWSEDNRKAQ
jgi:hypothetical protein